MKTRREFLGLLPLTALGTLLVRPDEGAHRRIVHPDPRPGIDATQVMPREALAAFPEEIVEIYDMVREIPHIADGIGCSCGCAAMPGYRSLLTCYYSTGMAMGCVICQGQAKLAHGRFKEGQSLSQIRRATDARFG
jgi:hypothetical protein